MLVSARNVKIVAFSFALLIACSGDSSDPTSPSDQSMTDDGKIHPVGNQYGITTYENTKASFPVKRFLDENANTDGITFYAVSDTSDVEAGIKNNKDIGIDFANSEFHGFSFIDVQARDRNNNPVDTLSFVLNNYTVSLPDIDIKGLYHLSTGLPASNHNVKIIKDGTVVAELVTDEQGNTHVQLPGDGKYDIHFYKDGFIDRIIEEWDIENDMDINERVTSDTLALRITNEIARGNNGLDAPHPSYRWPDKKHDNREIIYNTSTEKTNGTPVDTTAFNTIKDIMQNDIQNATTTHKFPNGYFNDFPINKKEIPYLDWRKGEYIPGKLVTQYEDNLPAAGFVTTIVKDGYIDGSVITLQGNLIGNNDLGRNLLLHELARAVIKVERNTKTSGNVFHGAPLERPNNMGTIGTIVIQTQYSAPNKLYARDNTHMNELTTSVRN